VLGATALLMKLLQNLAEPAGAPNTRKPSYFLRDGGAGVIFLVEYLVMALSNARVVINWRIGAPCFMRGKREVPLVVAMILVFSLLSMARGVAGSSNHCRKNSTSSWWSMQFTSSI
jgi:hypothetical protein